MMKKATTVILATLLICACSGGDEHREGGESGPHSHSHSHEAGPHGGQILEVGAHVAHLEVIHSEETGKMTIYVLGPDLKTPVTLAKAPQLKLTTAEGPKVLATQAEDAPGGAASVFIVTHDALKVHGPEGRITLELNGKIYNPDLVHHHEHE